MTLRLSLVFCSDKHEYVSCYRRKVVACAIPASCVLCVYKLQNAPSSVMLRMSQVSRFRSERLFFFVQRKQFAFLLASLKTIKGCFTSMVISRIERPCMGDVDDVDDVISSAHTHFDSAASGVSRKQRRGALTLKANGEQNNCVNEILDVYT